MGRKGKYGQGNSFHLLPGKHFLHSKGTFGKLDRIKCDARRTEMRDNPEFKLRFTLKTASRMGNLKPVTRVPLKCLEQD